MTVHACVRAECRGHRNQLLLPLAGHGGRTCSVSADLAARAGVPRYPVGRARRPAARSTPAGASTWTQRTCRCLWRHDGMPSRESPCCREATETGTGRRQVLAGDP